jgi:hypothetical protein
MHTATVKDREIMEMREKITNSFQAHVLDSGEGITLKRTLALSTINNMPRDICILAEDMMVALVILPFHRVQRQDGTLDGGNQGFRYVNRKVMSLKLDLTYLKKKLTMIRMVYVVLNSRSN